MHDDDSSFSMMMHHPDSNLNHDSNLNAGSSWAQESAAHSRCPALQLAPVWLQMDMATASSSRHDPGRSRVRQPLLQKWRLLKRSAHCHTSRGMVQSKVRFPECIMAGQILVMLQCRTSTPT